MTKEQAKEIIGICTKCGEHTPLWESCCMRPIFFEGGYLDPESVEGCYDDEVAE